MLKLIRRSVTGNKTRFALTALAILMGVSFVSATYVYTDTTKKAFDGIFASAFAGIDAQVSAQTEFSFALPPTFDESIVDAIAAVDGVATAIPNLQRIGVQYVTTDDDGNPTTLTMGGAPNIGGYFPVELGTEFQGIRILEGGAPPTEPNHVLVDKASAETLELSVGDTVEILTPIIPAEVFTVVGITAFGDLDSLGGATFALFTLDTMQRIAGVPGEIDGVSVFADEAVSATDLVPAINEILPEDLKAVSAQDAAEDASADVAEGLGFFTTFLNVFGFIALFVGAFLISNTFRIVVAQRTKELALLRAMGASRRQIRRLVLGEAAVTGLIASILGIVGGLGLAALLQRILTAAGLTFPTTSLQLLPRTVIVALIIGVGVTVGAAYYPARRAARISPVEAMRDSAPQPRRDLGRRILVGGAINSVALVAIFAGLAGFEIALPAIGWVGLGAAALMIGSTVLAPVVASPVTKILGAPLRKLFPASGKLAGENSRRQPRRTSATAGAIMVGVALVAMASVLVASFSATVDEFIDNGIEADLFVQPENQFQLASFTPELAERIAADPDVTAVTTLRQSPAIIDDGETFIAAFEPEFENFITFTELEGTFELSIDGIVVDRGDADSNGWVLGSTVDARFPSGDERTFTVQAIYAGEGIAGSAISQAALAELAPDIGDAQVYIQLADGADIAAAKMRVETLAEDVPNVDVFTVEDLRSSFQDQLNQLLTIITALLGMAIIISLFGVTNTMTLSIFERTREIGLLRAVGMTRRQTRGMILSEASIISMFGAVLGVVMGVFFGWAIIRALADEGLNSFAIPVGTLIGWVLALGVLGVLFALWPARRAARLNVLEAVTYE
jgi:putative ABC transport system permease protein